MCGLHDPTHRLPLPSDNRISGRTITSKTTSALTGLAGNKNVGTPSRPNCPKP